VINLEEIKEQEIDLDIPDFKNSVTIVKSSALVQNYLIEM